MFARVVSFICIAHAQAKNGTEREEKNGTLMDLQEDVHCAAKQEHNSKKKIVI